MTRVITGRCIFAGDIKTDGFPVIIIETSRKQLRDCPPIVYRGCTVTIEDTREDDILDSMMKNPEPEETL